MTVELDVNGEVHTLDVPALTPLLDVLRESLGLVGAKRGCGHGQCGACTVLVDGRRVLSCLQLAATVDGAVRTIEGLGEPDALHPLQQAFIDEDAFQCGYCTPGQIMSGIALIASGEATDDATIREAMSGNLCRCGAYPGICRAIARVAQETP